MNNLYKILILGFFIALASCSSDDNGEKEQKEQIAKLFSIYSVNTLKPNQSAQISPESMTSHEVINQNNIPQKSTPQNNEIIPENNNSAKADFVVTAENNAPKQTNSVENISSKNKTEKPTIEQNISVDEIIINALKPCWNQFGGAVKNSVTASFTLDEDEKITDNDIHYVSGDNEYAFFAAKSSIKKCLNENKDLPKSVYDKNIEIEFTPLVYSSFDMHSANKNKI